MTGRFVRGQFGVVAAALALGLGGCSTSGTFTIHQIAGTSEPQHRVVMRIESKETTWQVISQEGFDTHDGCEAEMDAVHAKTIRSTRFARARERSSYHCSWLKTTPSVEVVR